jgi:hypothetical protein
LRNAARRLAKSVMVASLEGYPSPYLFDKVFIFSEIAN